MLENPKHEFFAQALIISKGNLTSAYSQTYPKASYQSCRQGGWLLSKNVNIQRRLQEHLEKHGLSLESCIKKLNELTEARKLHCYGEKQSVMLPDSFIRLQAIQTALKIHVMLGNSNDLIQSYPLSEQIDQKTKEQELLKEDSE